MASALGVTPPDAAADIAAGAGDGVPPEHAATVTQKTSARTGRTAWLMRGPETDVATLAAQPPNGGTRLKID